MFFLADSYEKRYRYQQIRYLKRKAAKLGLKLIPAQPPPRAVS